jgi:hypothetical protein
MAQQQTLTVKQSGTQGSGMKAKLAQIKIMDNVKGYKVGWPATATYPDGALVAEVALYQEFGVPENNLPERPFFRTANRHFARNANRWIVKLAKNGVIDRRATLSLGSMHVRLVQSSIDLLKNPPLKVRVGGNPLVDTGVLRNNVQRELI